MSTSVKTHSLYPLLQNEAIIQALAARQQAATQAAPWYIHAACPDTEALAQQLNGKSTADIILLNWDEYTRDSLTQTVHTLQKRFPHSKLIGITSQSPDLYLPLALETEHYSLLWQQDILNPNQLAMLLDEITHYTTAETASLQPYLSADAQVTTTLIRKSDDIARIFQAIYTLLKEGGVQETNDLSTALMEALTNSVYHAPKQADGVTDKYKKGEPLDTLLPEEYVTVRYGSENGRVGIAISDQGGKLPPGLVMKAMSRHWGEDGLLDTDGRGFYLMHLLSEQLTIRIVPNVKTELVMIHSQTGASNRDGLRPPLILY